MAASSSNMTLAQVVGRQVVAALVEVLRVAAALPLAVRRVALRQVVTRLVAKPAAGAPVAARRVARVAVVRQAPSFPMAERS